MQSGTEHTTGLNLSGRVGGECASRRMTRVNFREGPEICADLTSLQPELFQPAEQRGWEGDREGIYLTAAQVHFLKLEIIDSGEDLGLCMCILSF